MIKYLARFLVLVPILGIIYFLVVMVLVVLGKLASLTLL